MLPDGRAEADYKAFAKLCPNDSNHRWFFPVVNAANFIVDGRSSFPQMSTPYAETSRPQTVRYHRVVFEKIQSPVGRHDETAETANPKCSE